MSNEDPLGGGASKLGEERRRDGGGEVAWSLSIAVYFVFFYIERRVGGCLFYFYVCYALELSCSGDSIVVRQGRLMFFFFLIIVL